MNLNTPVAGATAEETVKSPMDTSSFVPMLDARQRAMLAEMGVRVWAPKPPAAAPVQTEVQLAVPAAARSLAQASVHSAAANTPQTGAPTQPTVPVSAARQTTTAPPFTSPALDQQPMAEGIEAMDWAQLRQTVASCQACGMCKGRTQAVFGVGHQQADWLMVGDAPGATEDLQGEPYLGEAGQLLDSMLSAVGRSRTGQGIQAAYVTHVLKCRPATNRNPTPGEVAQCAHYLAREVALVQPKVIIALGPLAVLALLNSQEPIGKLRAQVHRFQGVPVVVTSHPAALERSPVSKGKAWADLCLALDLVGC